MSLTQAIATPVTTSGSLAIPDRCTTDGSRSSVASRRIRAGDTQQVGCVLPIDPVRGRVVQMSAPVIDGGCQLLHVGLLQPAKLAVVAVRRYPATDHPHLHRRPGDAEDPGRLARVTASIWRKVIEDGPSPPGGLA